MKGFSYFWINEPVIIIIWLHMESKLGLRLNVTVVGENIIGIGVSSGLVDEEGEGKEGLIFGDRFVRLPTWGWEHM